MKNTTNLCKIQGYRGGYKWPKLNELHYHLFRRHMDSEHHAGSDVRNCAKCFFKLKSLGHIDASLFPTKPKIILIEGATSRKYKVKEVQNELLGEKQKPEARLKELEAKISKPTERKKQLNMGVCSSLSSTIESFMDGPLIAYDNGTVMNTETGLMWAAKDNGEHIDWQGAKFYCNNYRGGGYKDWRMPTQNELEGLYTPKNQCLSKSIRLTGAWTWASETDGSDAANFRFGLGLPAWTHRSDSGGGRVRPVRSGKRDDYHDNDKLMVIDKLTGLMWAENDNGDNIDWQDAMSYCNNYHGGGYKDWRMPKLNELKVLYKKTIINQRCPVRNLHKKHQSPAAHKAIRRCH